MCHGFGACRCSCLGCIASRDLERAAGALAGLDAAAQDAAIEKFVASKGGTPIVENQTRLIFLVKDQDGFDAAHRRRLQRLGGDAAGLRRLDRQDRRGSRARRGRISRARRTRTRASSTCLFFDKDAVPDPLNPRTVPAFAGPRSEVRMPFFVAQPEVDEIGSAPKGELIAERSTRGRSAAPARLVLPAARLRRGDGHAVPGRLRPRRRELRREDGRAAGARSPDRQQDDSAGDRGVLGAGRSAGGVFAQSEVARVRRRRAGADGGQALPHVPDAGPSHHPRQLAGGVRRDRSRGRGSVGVRPVRGHRPAGADRHGGLEPGRRPAPP